MISICKYLTKQFRHDRWLQLISRGKLLVGNLEKHNGQSRDFFPFGLSELVGLSPFIESKSPRDKEGCDVVNFTDSDEHSSINSFPNACSAAAVDTDESRFFVDDIEMVFVEVEFEASAKSCSIRLAVCSFVLFLKFEISAASKTQQKVELPRVTLWCS